MSLKRKLARLLLFAVLEAGAVLGVPINPRQIEDLLNVMNRPSVVMKQKTNDKK